MGSGKETYWVSRIVLKIGEEVVVAIAGRQRQLMDDSRGAWSSCLHGAALDPDQSAILIVAPSLEIGIRRDTRFISLTLLLWE